MKKTLSFVLVFSMILAMFTGIFTVEAGAKQTTAAGNTWTGDDFAVEIKAGENGYTFKSVYQKPGHAYEMSGHMVSINGGVNNDIPQTLILVDASKDYTWTPNGVYSFSGSNYEVLYCCDAVTGYEDGIYYKRMNLEDSSYYNEESAAHIRAIVTNSYPYVSLEQMKASLKADGFEGAEELTRAEIISAVQSAIWAYANVEVGEYKYSQTFNVCKNSQWGTVMHDTSAEMSEEVQALGKRKFIKDEAAEARINSLIEHLKNQKAVYAEKNAIVISKLEIVDSAPVQAKAGTYTVAMKLALNNSGSSEADNISIDLYVDDVLASSTPVELGKDSYDLTVEAKANQKITAVVNGSQFLPQGVYFYEPEGGRDVSQSLVGVAGGFTAVYADASVTLDIPEEEIPVTVDLKINKINEKGNALTGASFALYAKKNGTEILVGEYAVDANGSLVIENILPGNYVIAETVTPNGYESLAGTIGFTVSEEGALRATSLPAGVKVSGTDGIFEIEVTNVRTKTTISGTKYLDGALASGFEFELYEIVNGKEVYVATAQSNEEGKFSFTIEYDAPNTSYKYVVKEVQGNNVNIIYDGSVFEATVEIDAEGIATVSYEQAIVFNNVSVAPAAVVIDGEKYLDGELADGFTFVLTDAEGNEIERVECSNGYFAFSEIEFDAAATYYYYVSEIAGDDESIIYDDNVFEIKVVVEKQGDRYFSTLSIMRAEKVAFYNETIPEETTEAPEETTEAPEETTEAPEETTEAPEETTEAPEATTEAPEETTEAPEETTEAPEVTTEPEEEITEEPTPLDPTPEIAEGEEEIEDPEIPLDPNPKTGDASILLAIAAIAAIALAALYIKRRQVIED
jgi:pilin isopeptide linkage protein/TQXA domain-containing protein/LPXTG-motif cell wall-anchored protein